MRGTQLENKWSCTRSKIHFTWGAMAQEKVGLGLTDLATGATGSQDLRSPGAGPPQQSALESWTATAHGSRKPWWYTEMLQPREPFCARPPELCRLLCPFQAPTTDNLHVFCCSGSCAFTPNRFITASLHLSLCCSSDGALCTRFSALLNGTLCSMRLMMLEQS